MTMEELSREFDNLALLVQKQPTRPALKPHASLSDAWRAWCGMKAHE